MIVKPKWERERNSKKTQMKAETIIIFLVESGVRKVIQKQYLRLAFTCRSTQHKYSVSITMSQALPWER